MTISRRLVTMALLVAATAAAPLALSLLACSSPKLCSPETFDLGGATSIIPTVVAQVPRTCDTRGVTVVSDSAGLDSLRTDLADAGIDAEATASVDFESERLVAVEHLTAEGVSWTVIDGRKIVVGLLGCSATVNPTDCTVDVFRVSSPLQTGETRTCDQVGCNATHNTH